MQYLWASLIGLASGVISGLFGVGGGIIMVPAMTFFLSLNIKSAIGTSLAVIIPTALIGTFKHYTQGNVDWKVFLTVAPLAIVGGYCGAWLTLYISGPNLKRTFGGFLVLIGLRLLFGR